MKTGQDDMSVVHGQDQSSLAHADVCLPEDILISPVPLQVTWRSRKRELPDLASFFFVHQHHIAVLEAPVLSRI